MTFRSLSTIPKSALLAVATLAMAVAVLSPLAGSAEAAKGTRTETFINLADGASHTTNNIGATGNSVTVKRTGATLSVTAVTRAAGWASETEVASGLEVEVNFAGPSRAAFNAELEDGQTRIRVTTGK